MTRTAGRIACVGAIAAGLALVGVSFQGVAGLDRELERSVVRDQPRLEVRVHEVVVGDGECRWRPQEPA